MISVLFHCWNVYFKGQFFVLNFTVRYEAFIETLVVTKLFLLWNRMFNHHVHRSPPLAPSLSLFSPLHNYLHISVKLFNRLGFPCGLFPRHFATKIAYGFLIFTVRNIVLHWNILKQITVICGKSHKKGAECCSILLWPVLFREVPASNLCWKALHTISLHTIPGVSI